MDAFEFEAYHRVLDDAPTTVAVAEAADVPPLCYVALPTGQRLLGVTRDEPTPATAAQILAETLKENVVVYRVNEATGATEWYLGDDVPLAADIYLAMLDIVVVAVLAQGQAFLLPLTPQVAPIVDTDWAILHAGYARARDGLGLAAFRATFHPDGEWPLLDALLRSEAMCLHCGEAKAASVAPPCQCLCYCLDCYVFLQLQRDAPIEPKTQRCPRCSVISTGRHVPCVPTVYTFLAESTTAPGTTLRVTYNGQPPAAVPAATESGTQ